MARDSRERGGILRAPWSLWFSGYLTIHGTTARPGDVIEQMRLLSIPAGDFRLIDEGTIEFVMKMRDFKKMRAVRRSSGSQFRIHKRHGFPVWRRSSQKWLFFWMIACFAVISLYVLASIIWRVDVVGNARISSERILQVAGQHGIAPFRWTNPMRHPTIVARMMQRQLPGVTWLGIERRGVTVRIRVVEARPPEVRKTYAGHHLLATKTAIVSKLFAERGQAQVDARARVRKGEVLISGWIGSDEQMRLVQAVGTARGFVWYNVHIRVPLVQKIKVYTGRTATRDYWFWHNRALRFRGQAEPPFAKFETLIVERPWRLSSLSLPFGAIHEVVREVGYVQRVLTPLAAKRIGILQAHAHIRGNFGKRGDVDAAVIRKQHLIVLQRTKSELVMRVFFEVEENIGRYGEISQPSPTPVAPRDTQ